LVDWVANYTLSARGMVLRMCLRMGEDLGPERVRLGVRLAGPAPKRLTPARRRLIGCCRTAAARQIRRRQGSRCQRRRDRTASSMKALSSPKRCRARCRPPPPDPSHAQPNFPASSAARWTRCAPLAANGSFHVALLDGVTGSGKTEVYFEAVAEIIRRAKQSLILMPEIALTGHSLDRFTQRFGVRPLEWHSELTPRTRARNWARDRRRRGAVVVGARSALFLPYANLGLIVVDEEHDQAYKQDDGVHYHARDMAVVRAHIAKFRSCWRPRRPRSRLRSNARKARYQRVVLPSRFGGQHMPHIEASTSGARRRRAAASSRRFSPSRSGSRRKRREQALLFLNRRGYAPLTLCRACGHSLRLHHLRRLAGRSSFSASAWSATIAASRCRARRPVRTARRRNRWFGRSRRGAAAGRRRRCFRRRAPWCCRATDHVHRDHAAAS